MYSVAINQNFSRLNSFSAKPSNTFKKNNLVGTVQDSFHFQTNRQGSISAASFRFKGNTKRSNTSYDQALYEESLKQYKEPVYAVMRRLDITALNKRFPELQKTYDALGLNGWIGIPPLVETVNPDGPGHDSRGIIGFIILKALEELHQKHPASSFEEVLAQLDLTFDAIDSVARYEFKQLDLGRFSPDMPSFVRDNGTEKLMTQVNPEVYSYIYKGHVVFAARNGAFQALKLPTYQNMML